jgi:transposase
VGIIMSALEVTVEALMYSLRSRGTKALEEPETKRRLSDLSDQQVIEVGNRLQRLKPEIARKWTKEEVEILLQARIG